MSDPIAEFLDEFPHATWASTGAEGAEAIRQRLAPEFAAAFEAGYARAVANLRDDDAYRPWSRNAPMRYDSLPARERYALYLEAQATKENTDA